MIDYMLEYWLLGIMSSAIAAQVHHHKYIYVAHLKRTDAQLFVQLMNVSS